MKKKFILLLVLLAFSAISFSQTDIIILHSNTNVLDIKDNGTLKNDYWTVLPDVKTDRYITQNKNSYVTFYSDIDSASFYIEPNKKTQFLVVLNDKDTALTEILYLRPFIDILKDASEYKITKKPKEVEFTYQSKDNSHLKKLREKYNLDSIAGKGDEISQLKNVMKWLHDKVPHRGSDGNPKKKNADYMLTACSVKNRGLNCRGLAIAYNECCLSLGFKSRYVTCLPKDSLGIDNDCHVINMVFVKKLNKWIWLDPTYNAYVLNSNNELLSIEEVRKSLIDDKPLKINDDANWNNETKTDINYYLYQYMAKNLYRIQCPIKSKYNNETNIFWKVISNDLNFVQLTPVDYKKDVSSFSNRVCTNPEVFWKKPI